MNSSVFPFPTYLFQFLFLLIAISVEAFIIHRRLKLSRKTSIEYAISLNLVSTVIGWLAFFYGQTLIGEPLKTQIISYVFFNTFVVGANATAIPTEILLAAFITFMATFWIEFKGLDLLEVLLEVPQPTEVIQSRGLRYRNMRATGVNQIFSRANTRKAGAILLANGCSYSLILLILLILSL